MCRSAVLFSARFLSLIHIYREQLARLLGASDTQMSYVDNAPAGHGLIKVGGAIVPFANELPKNTELYRLMSTRPGED